MEPRRTPESNVVFRLPGGTEDNDLWVKAGIDEDGYKVICSVWELSESEREAVSKGANIELAIWSSQHPPVSLIVTDTPLGADGSNHRHIVAEARRLSDG